MVKSFLVTFWSDSLNCHISICKFLNVVMLKWSMTYVLLKVQPWSHLFLVLNICDDWAAGLCSISDSHLKDNSLTLAYSGCLTDSLTLFWKLSTQQVYFLTRLITVMLVLQLYVCKCNWNVYLCFRICECFSYMFDSLNSLLVYREQFICICIN